MRVRPSAVALIALTCTVGACASASPESGVVTGSVPFCNGPGRPPASNLTPVVTVFVHQNGRLVAHGRFPSNDLHPQPYRFSLDPGAYSLTSSSDHKSVAVRILSGQTTRADLPSPDCF
jgi:hypothetical protein